MDDKERLRHILRILSYRYDDNDNDNDKSKGKSPIDDFVENHSVSKILDHIG